MDRKHFQVRELFIKKESKENEMMAFEFNGTDFLICVKSTISIVLFAQVQVSVNLLFSILIFTCFTVIDMVEIRAKKSMWNKVQGSVRYLS